MRVSVCIALLLTAAATVLATKEDFASPQGMQNLCILLIKIPVSVLLFLPVGLLR